MKTTQLLALIMLLGAMDQYTVKADAVIEEIEEGSTNSVPSDEADATA